MLTGPYLWSLFCFLLLTFCCDARALPAYLETAKTTYGISPGSAIDAKGCNLCHAGVTNKNSLNFYGKDIRKALNSAAVHEVTPALLHSLDAADSDGDGWSNAAEFKGNTLPGDPSSKPNGPPPGSLKPRQSAMNGQEANPFSLQSLFFPSHAQHPVIVHFPIALFVFSLFLDLIGLRTGNRKLNSAGYLNLVAAAATGILSVITGLLAWRMAFHGEPLTSDRWLLSHLILGVVTTVLMCLLWLIRARYPKDSPQPVGALYVALGIVTLAVIGLTGHLGGVVTGVVN